MQQPAYSIRFHPPTSAQPEPIGKKGVARTNTLDHDGYLPSFPVVTEGKYSELNVARDLRLKPGTILAVDRGYNDYVWFGELTRQGVFFVTLMKTNTVYTTVEVYAVPEKGEDP